jgi:hypothetical protein
MLLAVDDRQASVLLGAAKAVATGGDHGMLSDAAAGAISSLAVLGLGIDPPDLDTLNPSIRAQLSAALDDSTQVTTSIEALAVMALVDGTLDAGRIGRVTEFATGLGFRDDWLADLSMSLDDDLGPVIAEMGGSQSAQRHRRTPRPFGHRRHQPLAGSLWRR